MKIGEKNMNVGNARLTDIFSKNKSVIIRAPLLSVSGYGVHSRQIYKWLENRNDMDIIAQVVQWGNTSWMINNEMENGLVGRIVQNSRDLNGQADISIQVQLPDEWDSNLAKLNIGVSAVVETDCCNPLWIDAMDKMDAVIVPSEHIKKTILNTKNSQGVGTTKTRIFVIPEWYHEEIDNESYEQLGIKFDTDFNFLLVSQFTGHDPYNDRKNIFNTIKWFCEAFTGDRDVGLVIKTNHGRGTTIDRQITKNKLRQLISDVRVGDFPKIHLIHGNLTASEIAGLYNHPQVKCFLSLTRGEGFGLPILEASACALPVITTNWSAQLDFLGLGKFIPISYNLIDIPQSKVDDRIFISGMKWADPAEEDFKKKVTKFRKKSTIPSQWAKDLSKKIRESFCSTAIMSIYDDMISELTE